MCGAVALVACSPREPAVTLVTIAQPGELTTNDVEISGVVDVPRDHLVPQTIAITGDGHSHDVPITQAACGALAMDGSAVVRSGPASTDGHQHWLRARLA